MEEQQIRFAEEGGRRIAWARSGVGPPLVFCGWWMSHLELNWRDPRFRAFVEALGRHRTVIRYDAPGTGLSADGGPGPATLDAGVEALTAVMDAYAAAPVDLFAGSSGAPVGVAFAAARPQQVERLLVYGGYASGSSIADYRTRRAMVDLVREHWGLGSRILADVFMPSADGAERDAFVAYQRQVSDAEQAARSLEAVYAFDAAAQVAAVKAPAIVLHRRQDRSIPFELGRDLAAELPGASLVALDGADHYPWFGDSDAVLRAALSALGVDGGAVVAAAPTAGRAPLAATELTSRETEVLTLVASGLSDGEIAERLVLSPHTVHRHVANVRTKLGLPTRAAAVAEATRRGLL
ncbi:MAG TPA: alpha/beta fold hydrolase [Solirubrobacterales bacterium]|nr:alpha/beta fold hydrolase [Solirubrobacterales bacterium]